MRDSFRFRRVAGATGEHIQSDRGRRAGTANRPSQAAYEKQLAEERALAVKQLRHRQASDRKPRLQR
jgi:hypothetical protein